MRKYLFCLFITISVLLTTGCDQAPSTTPLIIPPSTTEPPATTAPETPAETTPQTPANTTPENPVFTTPITTPVTPQQQYVWLCVREEQHQKSDLMGLHTEIDSLATRSYDYYHSSTDYKCRSISQSNSNYSINNTTTSTTYNLSSISVVNGNQAEAVITGSINTNGTVNEVNETISYSFVPGTNGLITLSQQSSDSTSSSFTYTLDNVENDESGSTYKIIMSDTMYALFKINNGKMVFIKQYSTSNGEPQLYNETVYSDSSIPLIQEIGLQNYSETMLSLSTTQYTYTVTSSTDTIADITLLRDGNVYKTLRYEKRKYPFEN